MRPYAFLDKEAEAMEMYREPRPVEDYLDRELVCGCGRTHYVPIRAVEIGPGALETLPDYTRRFG